MVGTEVLGQAYRVEFCQIGEAVHLDHVVADCVECAADVESASNKETAVVPARKLACGEVCYSAAEDDSVLNGDVEHVGSLPDKRIITPCASCTRLCLRDLHRYHQQVEGFLEKH